METECVAWERGEVTVCVRGGGDLTILLAHGAGTDQSHRLMVGLAEALVSNDLRVVTFNYPYSEAGRKAPDRAPTLLACHRDIAGHVRRRFPGRLVMAGRSMGGRMASMLAADGEPMDGLVLYAYPLHPAGAPERLRVEHLPAITVPMLFFQGDRDKLAHSDLFDRHLRPLGDVVDLPGVDHSWRGKGVTEASLLAEVSRRTAEWVRRLATDGPSLA